MVERIPHTISAADYAGFQIENERLKEALKRLASGEAMYVPTVIPIKFRSEITVRYRFIELVLEGKDVKDASKQAYQEQVERTAQALKKYENGQLKALCLRESKVLKEALKRKNNKSMISVVADSLEEQALKEK